MEAVRHRKFLIFIARDELSRQLYPLLSELNDGCCFRASLTRDRPEHGAVMAPSAGESIAVVGAFEPYYYNERTST